MYTLSFLKGVSIYNFEGSIWSKQDTIYDVNHFKTLLAEDNFYSNFPTLILHEGHPPLYFVLLKPWSYVFGFSEVALRSFSLCCGLISLLVLFTLFRKKAKHTYTAWLVLIMLIFNPFLFYFFTEARMYALAFLLAVLSFRYWIVYQEGQKN
jgi:4-amino-4-deoxy-L-arabinose transferase-like glycosyltransferase